MSTTNLKQKPSRCCRTATPPVRVAQRLGVSCPTTIRRWKRQQLEQAALVADAIDSRVKTLEAELRRVERERDVLKSFDYFRPPTVGMLYPAAMSIIDQGIASEREVCQFRSLSRSQFQRHKQFEKTAREESDAQLQPLITSIFHRHRRRYGSRRIVEELKSIVVAKEPQKS